MASATTNTKFKDYDLELWERYRRTKSAMDRDALLRRFEPLIQSQVSRWAGPVSRDILVSKAKLLALKAFDTYTPDKGAALATHITNGLAPLSRVVYTHQNTARMPENVTLKVQAFNAARDHLTTVTGREPTTDELHQELGWSAKEISRVDNYMRKDLVESVGGMNDNFYDDRESDDEDTLAAVFYDLTPTEKQLMEYTTGYNGKPTLTNPEIMKRLGLSQAQLSYQKTLLTKKIKLLMEMKRGRRAV